MVTNELASWEQMTDASGRLYLVDRRAGVSKWLWAKWAAPSGEIFCENIITKERRYAKDMDMNMKVQAGMATPAEVKRFLAIGSAPSHKPNTQVYPQQQQRDPYSSYRDSMATNMYHNSSVNTSHHQSQHHQYQYNSNPRMGDSNSYSAVAGGSSSYTSPNTTTQQQQGSNFLNTGYTHNASQQTGSHHNGQPHGFSQSGRNWNQPSYRRSKPQPTPSTYTQQSSSNYGVSVGGSSTVDEKWRNTRMEPERNGPSQYQSRSENVMSDVRAGGGYSKRNVSTQQDDGSQYGHGRFWRPVKTQQMKRSGRNVMNGTDNKSIYRAKPIPLSTDLLTRSVPQRKIGPTNTVARAMLEHAKSHVNVRMIVAMHARDFANKTGADDGSKKVSNNELNDEFVSSSAIVGTCQKIEKEYLRLTSAPKPELVRPPQVLKQSLQHVKLQWDIRARDYDWVCRQMKSIRQDYKVQHIETIDSLLTYETHARLALENGDLGEFNTCVAQAQDLHGKVECEEERKDEFASYRIIYNVLVGESSYEQARLLAKLTAKERARPATKFALEVRNAFLSDNFHQFFKLCAQKEARETVLPFLLLRLIPSIRSKALAMCVKAHAPTKIPLTYILSELGFVGAVHKLETQITPLPERENNEDLAALCFSLGLAKESRAIHKAIEFLTSINIVFERVNQSLNGIDNVVIDCKASKLKGVEILDRRLGLITCAGGQ